MLFKKIKYSYYIRNIIIIFGYYLRARGSNEKIDQWLWNLTCSIGIGNPGKKSSTVNNSASMVRWWKSNWNSSLCDISVIQTTHQDVNKRLLMLQFADAVKQRFGHASSGLDHAFILGFRLCTTWSWSEAWRGEHTCARLEAIDRSLRQRIHARGNDQGTRQYCVFRDNKRVHVAPTEEELLVPCVSCQIEPAVRTGNKSVKSGNECRSPARHRYFPRSYPNATHTHNL